MSDGRRKERQEKEAAALLRTEKLLCIYIGVFLCMLAFQCVLLLCRCLRERRLEGFAVYFTDLLNQQIDAAARGEDPDPGIQRILQRKLRTSGGMTSFYQAVSRREEETAEGLEKYLNASLAVFEFLAADYGKKGSEQQAYFAYILYRLPIGKGLEQGPIIDLMMRLVAGESVFCRENALKALYSFGSAENVLRALRLIDENDIFHHGKLLSDGLSTFQGDREKLFLLLKEHFKEFREPLQVAVLDYIRRPSDGCQDQIYDLLQNPASGLEVRIAAARYFGRNICQPAKALLQRILLDETGRQWELRAVCASVLRNYPDQETVRILKRTLEDPNWYIRFNSGESLNVLRKSFSGTEAVYSGSDPCAREMIDYQAAKEAMKDQAGGRQKEGSG